jgi:hypothetical protein
MNYEKISRTFKKAGRIELHIQNNIGYTFLIRDMPFTKI